MHCWVFHKSNELWHCEESYDICYIKVVSTLFTWTLFPNTIKTFWKLTLRKQLGLCEGSWACWLLSSAQSSLHPAPRLPTATLDKGRARHVCPGADGTGFIAYGGPSPHIYFCNDLPKGEISWKTLKTKSTHGSGKTGFSLGDSMTVRAAVKMKAAPSPL